MVVNQPHFLLFTDAHLSQSRACAVSAQGFGRWHFVLERLDGPERLEAADSESDVHRDRLALLAVVRGLEALEQPSQVTLVTTSRYVSRGLRYGLNEWREAEYTWEHFGIQKPIRNADLWQRIDRAMSFHQVTCRLLQSPLAQAMVETATELDELTILTNPLDAPFDIAADRVQRANGNQTAAALARREVAAGMIQRVDSAHGSIGLGKSNSPLHGITDAVGQVELHAPAFDVAQSAAVLQAAVEMVQFRSTVGRSPIVQSDATLITELSELNGNSKLEHYPTSTFTYRRPRISITLPASFLKWMEWATHWVRCGRWQLMNRLVNRLCGVIWRPIASWKSHFAHTDGADSRTAMAPT